MDEQNSRLVSLSTFAIYGLHGRQNLVLNFNEKHSIFIADNGSGKTTALYLIQAIFAQDFAKATRFEFDKIEISFSDGAIFRIRRQAILDRPFAKKFLRFARDTEFSESDIYDLSVKMRHLSPSQMRYNPKFRKLSSQTGYSAGRLYELLRRYNYEISSGGDLFETSDDELEAFRSFTKEVYDLSVIYLPTYRRIEQDLSLFTDINAEDDEAFGPAIKFGMNDVKSRIEDLGEDIRSHLARTYTSVSGQMLHQLTKPASLSDEMLSTVQNKEEISAVLARLSNVISEDDRTEILNRASAGTLASNLHLSFFLHNLIRSYHEVSETEYALEKFGDVSNRYLLNKFFRYDPTSASLVLYESMSGDELDLNVLSSGEKQLIGVLSQVYLSAKGPSLVVFDEPELSLSVEWQKSVLPDIVASPNCHSLIAATHSPFIFQNELDPMARSFKSEYYFPAPAAEAD